MSDTLLQDVAAGIPDAVAECMSRYRGRIMGLARKYLRSAHDVEDAVQDVFLQLWRVADRYDPARGSTTSFVLTVARRRLLDAARRRGREPFPHSLADAGDVAALAEPDVLEREEAIERVREALDAIEPRQREVLQLSLVQGHTHQQVAERTGLPFGTVKSHARRGLALVRDLLRDHARESS
jgi:RNA polymerase sigma-70 factor (ECF subfamily)